jgi:hypothetical protein
MRALRVALSVAWAGFEPSRLNKWMGIAATVLATTVVVVLASFVAVAMGLT